MRRCVYAGVRDEGMSRWRWRLTREHQLLRADVLRAQRVQRRELRHGQLCARARCEFGALLLPLCHFGKGRTLSLGSSASQVSVSVGSAKKACLNCSSCACVCSTDMAELAAAPSPARPRLPRYTPAIPTHGLYPRPLEL